MDDWKKYKMPFGKYKWQTMYVILTNDWEYIKWLDNIMLGEKLRAAVDAAIKYRNEHLNTGEE